MNEYLDTPRVGDVVTIKDSIHIERAGETAEVVRIDNSVPVFQFRDGEEKPCPNRQLYYISIFGGGHR